MKERVKTYVLRIFVFAIVILLILGIVNSIFDSKEEKVEDYNVIGDNAVSEIYDENQVAFINYDEVYKYFSSIKDAEECKDRIIAKINSDGITEKLWIVSNVAYNSNNLMFYVSNNNIRYVININKYQTIIKRG